MFNGSVGDTGLGEGLPGRGVGHPKSGLGDMAEMVLPGDTCLPIPGCDLPELAESILPRPVVMLPTEDSVASFWLPALTLLAGLRSVSNLCRFPSTSD